MLSNTVTVISQRTLKVIATVPTGAQPQHVTPAWNLAKTLYVDNDVGNSLTPINPQTGRFGCPIPVEDPYNLYFTPNGTYAIVVAERLQRLDFRNPNTMRMIHSLSVPMCFGVDHMDFSPGGRYAFASCEFAGRMIEVDTWNRRLIRTLLSSTTATPAPRTSSCRPTARRSLHRGSAERRTVGDQPLHASRSSASCTPAPEPTACTPAARTISST